MSLAEEKMYTDLVIPPLSYDVYVQGFGAGNFKALFEAIEFEQGKRFNLLKTDEG